VSRVDLPLVVRMFGWALVLPVLKRVRPLPSLARLMWCDDRHRPISEQHVLAHAQMIYRGRPLFAYNCLERSLLVYRFLSEAGVEPTLVIGVRGRGRSLAAHAWVVVSGRPIGGDDGFEAVVAFGPHGEPIEAP
jgi:hypothetical protein